MTDDLPEIALRSCSVCDGEFSHGSACGCCGAGNCAVFCGCECPSEFWCDACRVYHENVHLCAGREDR
jgi:hypothetical protein